MIGACQYHMIHCTGQSGIFLRLVIFRSFHTVMLSSITDHRNKFPGFGTLKLLCSPRVREAASRRRRMWMNLARPMLDSGESHIIYSAF